MSWRIIYITNVDKLSLNLNSIQIIHENNTYFVSLNEIAMLVVEDYKSIITVRLLIELAKQGIPMIILGMNNMPIGEYFPIADNVRTAKRITEQTMWDDNIKNKLWTNIIKGKIENQIITLKELELLDKINILEEYIKKMKIGDTTNVEGICARVYFKELFGNEFIRFNETIENYCLNFAYHIIRTIISKEIVARGYIPSLGINHKSQYNVFNFADDIIEVFRPIVDYYVYNILMKILKSEIFELTKEIKIELINIVNNKVSYKNKVYSMINVVSVFISDIINFINLDGKEELEIPRLINE
ncbi:MAG: type II CRISPR-associated endonuclease Cas1 [Clostridia bacterium]|jgi:CRISPR-associated protein Cas1|nr:type II CRISPR-associated endonuclease Cas1 [Clostridia bacterium]